MATLETAARLGELPAVDAAMRAGELSPVQANEIASAAGADADAGAELVDVARNDGVAGLRGVVFTRRPGALGQDLGHC